jgi:hypothetical protein
MFELAANETVDITKIPEYVNDAMLGGTNLIAAELLVAAFVLFLVMLPMIYARAKPTAIIMVGILVLAGLTALGWVDPYVMGVLILITAALLATKAGDWLGA